MIKRAFGSTGLAVSALGLGCNNFGGRLDLEKTKAVVDAAIDTGVNFIDTADAYGNFGGSEKDARAIDRSRAQGAQLALAGLPIIIKDNINTAGFPTTAGTPFFKNYRPKANAPLADMLFKQGAILFAKSNMHELALGSTSANPTFGYVKNPYDLSRIPGRSNQGDRPLMNCAATSLLLRNADQRRATSRTPDLAAPPIWNERRCARPSDRLQFDWSRLRPSRQ